MIKRSLSSFIFIFLRVGCRDVHLSEWGSSASKNTIFIKMQETLPVCREHVHTGRPHTRIDYSILKRLNVMLFQ